VEQNLRFPGQYFLLESGLSYNWHRFYDASTGRYTQPDPLRFVDGPSVYGYATASPMMRVDPEGLSSAGYRGFLDGLGGFGIPHAPYPPLSPMCSNPFPPGFWPADKGAEEWGRRNGVGAREGKRRFHQEKQKDKGKGKDNYGVNPGTGEISNPDGDIIGNLDGN
jgi:RHS repeat-associated protein